MRVVVDVMGGDYGCEVVIKGALQALQLNANIQELFLVGRQPEIEAALKKCGNTDSRVTVVHASEVLTMDDKPVEGLRHKKDCSILRAVDLLKEGRAEAMVSPGNTGAVVAASTIRLRPLAEVDRPAIAAIIPAPKNQFVLLDAGANVECRPRHLAQYAIMGSVYSQKILGYASPRVGILSVGTEDVKGNELTLQAFKLCKQCPINFIGNIEGHDLFANRVDVVVCDGFVGNIVLKTCESLATNLFAWLKTELTSTPGRSLGAWMARGAFRTIKRRLDPAEAGGAPLLGLNGNVMIAHGAADDRAIRNAIRATGDAVKHNINQSINQEIARANAEMDKLQQPAHASS
jgi:phosphate acyltransferase